MFPPETDETLTEVSGDPKRALACSGGLCMTCDMAEIIKTPAGWSEVLGLTAREDFHAVWNALREQGAVLEAGDGLFLVTRWAEGQTFLRDPRVLAGSGTSE